MICNEALRSLDLRPADAGGHRGAIPREAGGVSSSDFGAVAEALKPTAGLSAALPLKLNIAV